jgi:hypothetical protein
MARRIDYEGVTWDVELAGPGTIGCGIRKVEVTFTSRSNSEAIPGRVSMTGDERLTDDHLVAALVEALCSFRQSSG